jgi:hypothetical protein
MIEAATYRQAEPNPVAMALSKQDAEMIGLWGTRWGGRDPASYTLVRKSAQRRLRTTWHVASGHGGSNLTKETQYGNVVGESASAPFPAQIKKAAGR